MRKVYRFLPALKGDTHFPQIPPQEGLSGFNVSFGLVNAPSVKTIDQGLEKGRSATTEGVENSEPPWGLIAEGTAEESYI